MSEKNSSFKEEDIFTVISPLEIDINMEDIFLREKYNDILNYIKSLLTSQNDDLINRFMVPQGKLLVNVPENTDILDFIKLISKNYYLNYLELNYDNVFKNLEKNNNFLDHVINKILNENFQEIIPKIESNAKTDLNLNNNEMGDYSNILVVEEMERFSSSNDNISLLELFLRKIKNRGRKAEIKNKNTIIFWITHDMNVIEKNSALIYDAFDLFIKISRLNDLDRQEFLSNFMEKNPQISFDLDLIVNHTKNWEIKELRQLIKVAIFKHYVNSELNSKTNEITETMLHLIESGEFIPFSIKTIQARENQKSKTIHGNPEMGFNQEKIQRIKNSELLMSDVLREIHSYNPSEFILSQFYEKAASEHYNELILIIDKLKKNEQLEKNDLKLLANYPFIMLDSPSVAQVNLEKAKKRIDQILKMFKNNIRGD